ncbi:hypothetical protein MKY54_01130 [Paenibacillus sp. FSL P2-0121]|uniref:hypothetical protein n=1 Tax=Paenibacillus sp. FSL P2-0121 TaxID=2921626 RepID=UPI0030D39793
MANTTKIRKRAEQLKGRPVCITLHDGRTYIGWITGLDKNGLTLSKPRKNKHRKSKKHSSSRSRKANVSGLMPLFGSLFGLGGGALGSAGAGAASSGGGGFGGFGGFGGIGNFIGMVQKTMPVMKMGYNMIKSISPFLNGLKGLMG